MRVIQRHNCSCHHHNASYFLHCAYPNLASVTGRGYIAVMTSCDDVAVALFERLRPARIHFNELGVFKCGPRCIHAHEIVLIDIDGPKEAA